MSMMPKYTLATGRQNSERDAAAPLWFRASTLLLLGAAITLLLAVLGDRIYTVGASVIALVAVVLALGCALSLHLHVWYQERRGVYATEREFASVFLHALDGILTLDDQGICLDANPAAFALLGAPPAALIGHSFQQFYEDPHQFERQWRAFRRERYQRGQTTLRRLDGLKVFVHYTAAANYVPGRHVVILCDNTEQVEAQASLRQSNWRLQLMADNIAEVFWMLDASTKKLVEVTPAYETITGRSLDSITRDPLSYEDLIHPADRVHVLTKLEQAVHSGHFDEEFRIVRPDGDVRWVWVKGNPFPTTDKVIRQLVGTAQDITARKLADSQVAEHLIQAETARAQADAARAEAEALRRATLALTQNLRMDAVLDTLLRCVLDIVPYDSASVLLTEGDGRLFVARESPPASANRPVVTFEPSENTILQRALLMKKNVHVADTREEDDWRETKALTNIRCWIAVPLTIGDAVLGLLSLGSAKPGTFTTEHFRLAKSLAIPAAVAIHNARLYEWAQIYAMERQSLLKKIDETSKPAENDALPPGRRFTN
jgi:PAS domain S-box-containing protein